MTSVSVLELLLSATIIALAGIPIVTAASFLAQSASATTDLTTNTTLVGEEESVSTTDTNTNSDNDKDVSSALLGPLFSFGEGEDIESDVNPINETYVVVSYSGNRIIVPPNTTGVALKATETGNFTINIKPNGLSLNQGQALIIAEDATSEEDENATITFVLLTRTHPDGSGSGTGVTYFSTNSTGLLAFLDNTVAIAQVEYSPGEGVNRFAEWEWKGGTLPFEDGESSTVATTANNNASSALLGRPFMIVDFETASVNAINDTFIEIETVNGIKLVPPNATAGTTIDATETTNTTIDILPNGLDIDKGQSLIVTEKGDDQGATQQENATTTFMDISHTNPDGSGTGTGVVFFHTNSTGQLAFLDNMVGINDSEFSERSGTIRVWEWKGGTLPFMSLLPQS
jgi:hypothetical protein